MTFTDGREINKIYNTNVVDVSFTRTEPGCCLFGKMVQLVAEKISRNLLHQRMAVNWRNLSWLECR